MSNATVKKNTWVNFLKYYGEENTGRKTRLGVFENGNDYWLEDELPLTGIGGDTHSDLAVIEIMLGNEMTHTIKDVKSVVVTFCFDGINDGLNITDMAGKTTILRFEN